MCGVYTEEWSSLTRPMTFGLGLGYHPLEGIAGNTHLSNLDDIGMTPSLHSILKYSILCEATDLRDKVYGIR